MSTKRYVKIQGIAADRDEYDVGVVLCTRPTLRVHWATCDEVYEEDPTDLEPATEAEYIAAREKAA